ncbi:MAG: aspartate aminotransferase family protein [Betaproteobacteria bacterium]|nr:aspartate aminotransferase family protein [Betaproteobacteria bacterium]MBI2288964.1 aspartate aminotransferase family protein [Betaproteobacteria bacterium]MBI3054408.1 aspartate aminotransferase family protein [Betaproteobacteria bacterium]
MSHVMNTYKRLPVAFERGAGVWVWDTHGKRYLDALAGIAVCGLGHSHPRLVEAITAQAGRLIHTSNLYEIELQERLADRLAAVSGMEEAFFCNSGCEANEAAIKIARLYGHGRGIESPATIVMDKSFHGRTMATLSATGSRKVQAGFEPLVAGFVRVPFDDLAAVRKVAENNRSVVAVLVELIQGEGGINICGAGYLHGLREICDANGWLLMLDEVQSGTGRTGKWFAFQNSGVKPDVMTLAKGLASGVPIGACLAAGPAAGVFKPGNHGSTFGGNPLACAAALATLDIIETENLMANAAAMGDFVCDSLRAKFGGIAGVREIRNKGLMIGIELDFPCGDLVTQALAAGLLINVTDDNVVRLLPPLTIKRDEAELLVEMLAPLITDFLARSSAAQPAVKTA